MTKRIVARMALLGLLAALSLPFLAVAKPPDLPVRSTVDCEEKPPQRVGEIKVIGNVLFNSDNTPYVLDPEFAGPFSLLLANPTLLDELKGVFCPGIEDVVESCWRMLLKHVPVTCAPASKPKTPHDRLIELLNTSEDLREIEWAWERIWFTDQPSHLTPQRWHGRACCGDGWPVERLTVMPTPVVEDDCPLKDILVTVQEQTSGCILFGLGVSSDVELLKHVPAKCARGFEALPYRTWQQQLRKYQAGEKEQIFDFWISIFVMQ